MKKRFISVLCLLTLIVAVLPVGSVVLADTDTHWELTYKLNGGAWHDGSTKDFVDLIPKTPVNSSPRKLPESPRREGYVFGGWFNEPTLETRFQYKPTNAANLTGNNANTHIRVNADKTVYAAWAEKEERVEWALKYHTNFDEPFHTPNEWILDDHSFQDDPIWGQGGIGYYDRELRRITPTSASDITDDMIPSWYTGARTAFGGGGQSNPYSLAWELSTFTEWRRSHTYGEDNWLTVQEYGRGPALTENPTGPGDQYGGTGGRWEALSNARAAIQLDSMYGAGTITNTNPLPPYYIVEVTVHNIDCGGRQVNPVTGRERPLSESFAITWEDWVDPVDSNRYNGYRGVTGPTSLFPGTSGMALFNNPNFRSATWDGGGTGATAVPGNAVAENGMYFLGILDYSNVRPNNNNHIHHHRKVVFDTDSNLATRSAGTGSAGWSQLWNADLPSPQFQGDGSRYTTMLWCTDVHRTGSQASGGLDVNSLGYGNYRTWYAIGTEYYSYTTVGTQWLSVMMTDKYLPGESYTFVIERTPEYYRMSQTGNWYHAGDDFTYEWTKFHFPYDDPRDPKFNYGRWTWHFNQTPEELRGMVPSNPTLDNPVYFRSADGETVEYYQWPADSGYPDSIVTGVPHVNYYDGYAEFSDFKLYVNTGYLYDLDVSSEPGGRIEGTPTGRYNAVTDVSLSAKADPGYVFTGWTFIDVNNGLNLDPSASELNFTMPTEDVKMVAGWERIPITSISIDSLSITTVARYGVYEFKLILNEGALGDDIEWELADPSLGYVDGNGTVTIFDKIGNVRLTATDPVSKLSRSITLRIAS